MHFLCVFTLNVSVLFVCLCMCVCVQCSGPCSNDVNQQPLLHRNRKAQIPKSHWGWQHMLHLFYQTKVNKEAVHIRLERSHSVVLRPGGGSAAGAEWRGGWAAAGTERQCREAEMVQRWRCSPGSTPAHRGHSSHCGSWRREAPRHHSICREPDKSNIFLPPIRKVLWHWTAGGILSMHLPNGLDFVRFRLKENILYWPHIHAVLWNLFSARYLQWHIR